MLCACSHFANRIQKELAEITLDPPPNCRYEKINWPAFGGADAFGGGGGVE